MRPGLSARLSLIASFALVALSCRSEGCRSDGAADAGARVEAGEAEEAGRAGAEQGPAHVAARRAVTRAKVPGISFAVVTRERDVSVGAAGLADDARKIEATGETVFQAASIAKLVVATCVMQMVEERLLALDEDVSKYLRFPVKNPAFKDPITLRMLLTHRSSIRDVPGEYEASGEGTTLGAFLAPYVARPTSYSDRAPGAAMTYSNVGFALAALAVERVARDGFAALSTRRVFTPLRMTSTGWTGASRGSLVIATPHSHENGRFVPRPPSTHAVYPSVDLRSSARDLARFSRAILGGGALDGVRILQQTSVDAMLRADAADAGNAPDTHAAADAGDQALAWQLRTLGSAHVAGHEGEDVGTTSALFLDVAAGHGIVMLANGDAFGSGDAERGKAIQDLVIELLAVARAR